MQFPKRLLMLMFLLLLTACAKGPSADQPKENIVSDEPNLTEPRNAELWEASPQNVFQSKIAIVKLQFFRGQMTKTGHDSAAEVPVELCGALSHSLADGQREALERFVRNEQRLYAKTREAMYVFYKRNYADYKKGWAIGAGMYGGGDLKDVLPEIVSGTELDRLITFAKIYVHRPGGADMRIGVECHSRWDEEHGLGILLTGDGVVEVGLAEIAYPSE